MVCAEIPCRYPCIGEGFSRPLFFYAGVPGRDWIDAVSLF